MIIIGAGTVIYWGAQFIKTNSPARQKLDDFKKSALWQNAVKDVKAWASDIFEVAGKKLDDEASDDEKKKLDDIIKRELAPKYGKDSADTSNSTEKVRGVTRGTSGQ